MNAGEALEEEGNRLQMAIEVLSAIKSRHHPTDRSQRYESLAKKVEISLNRCPPSLLQKLKAKMSKI